jgi:mono/diheme cytochrome c family protein
MISILFFAVMAWAASPLDEGEYLVRAASCRECHTPDRAPDFSGGLALPAEFGVFFKAIFFTPNITPDRDSGIGSWTETEFRRALREGVSPRHSYYYPAFPYRSFSKMTDSDMSRIFLYLRSREPVRKFNRPHELPAVFDQRWLMFGWQQMFFQGPGRDSVENIKMAEGPFVPDMKKPALWNRGAYLVEAVLHCTECHTPRNVWGGLEAKQWMAGSDMLFSGKSPPNITPDPATGVTWSREEWLEFLASGIDPEGMSPGVEMALAVRAASGLTAADREAVAAYLIALTPVRRYSKEMVPR